MLSGFVLLDRGFTNLFLLRRGVPPVPQFARPRRESVAENATDGDAECLTCSKAVVAAISCEAALSKHRPCMSASLSYPLICRQHRSTGGIQTARGPAGRETGRYDGGV